MLILFFDGVEPFNYGAGVLPEVHAGFGFPCFHDIYVDERKGVRCHEIRIDVQVYTPRIEPAVPIRLADRIRTRYQTR